MQRNLVSLLQIEGAATDQEDLDARLKEAGRLTAYAIMSGYYDAMLAVVELYKPARAKRELVDGVNVNEESVAAFRACADRFFEIIDQMPIVPSIVKALVMHNAASCLAAGNGNKPGDQAVLNESALTTLHAVWGGDPSVRDSADWHAVYAKVGSGLYEHGARIFDETVYRGLIDTMERIGSKDAAGRRLFLAKWLMSQGRIKDAIMAVHPVTEDDYVSAQNQIAEARAYLDQLMQSQS